MAYEMKNNSGTAFHVKDKKNEKHADISGSGIIDGRNYWINVWEKTSSKGENYLSFSFNPKQESEKKEESIFKKSSSKPFDDDISF